MYTAEELLAELEQCLNRMEFMHCCLADPDVCRYGHPEQTIQHLDRLRQIVGVRRYCSHSLARPNCPSCQETAHKRLLAMRVDERLNASS